MKRMATIAAVLVLILVMVIPVAAEPQDLSSSSLILTLDLSQIELPPGIDPGEVLVLYRAAQRQQLDELIPLLLLLKERGEIADFQPNLEKNCIALEGASQEALSTLRATPGVLGVKEASGDTLAESQNAFTEQLGRVLKTTSTSEIAGSARIYLTLDDTYVHGYVAPNKLVTLIVKTADGQLKAIGKDMSDDDGHFYIWSFFSGPFPMKISSSDIVIVKWGTKVLKKKMPRLTGKINVATDVVSGKGPAKKGLYIKIYHYYWTKSGYRSSWECAAAVRTGADGGYKYDFTSQADLKRGDYGWVRYISGSFWITRDYVYAPYIKVYEKHNYVYGYGRPNKGVTLTLKNKTGTTKATATTGTASEGSFHCYFYGGDDMPVPIQPSDRIAVKGPATGRWTMKAPLLTAKADAATDVVQGKAPARRWVRVGLYYYYARYGWYTWEYLTTRASTRGNYSVDFTSEADMKPDDYGYVYTILSSGNWVYRLYLVP